MAFDISTASNAQIAQAIYIAYYQRPAEPDGLDFWTNEAATLKADGATNLDVAVNFASRFADVQESQDRYPFLSNPTDTGADQFVQNVYQQLFGRQAEQAGEDFYSDRITEALNNNQPIGNVILDILAGAQNEDSNALENKVTAAESFTETVQNDGKEYETDAGRTMLDGVDETTADPAQTGTDAANQLPDAPNPGDSFTLTADVDDLTGTSNDDSYSAPLSAAGTQTLQDFDTIDGAEGTDELTATLTGNTVPNLTSVENLFFRAASNAPEVDMPNVEGAAQVWSNGSVSDLTVDEVQAPITVGAQNIRESATHDYTVDYAANALDDETSQSVALNNAVLTSLVINVDGDANNDTGLESLAIASQGDANEVGTLTADSTAGGGAATITEITISGSGDLEVGNGLNANVIDGSGASGALNLTLGATAAIADSTSAREVTLGSGDDVMDASAADLTADITIEGGDGSDEVVVDGGTANLVDNLVSKVSGFETLNLDSLDQSVGFSTFANIGFETLVVRDGSAGATVTGVSDGDDLVLADTGSFAELTLSVSGAASGSNDSFSLTARGIDGGNANYAGLTINDVENLNIETVDQDADTFQTTTLDFTSADALESLTLTGDEAVVTDVSATPAFDTLESVDASGITAESDASAGEYASTITVGDQGASVTGSSNADSITFGLGTDVTGNGGDDQLVYDVSGGTPTNTNFATIADFEAGDQLFFGGTGSGSEFVDLSDDISGGGTDLVEVAVTTAPGVDATFGDFLDTALGADGTTAGDVGQEEVGVFQFDGNTYFIYNSGDGTNGDFDASTGEISNASLVEVTGTSLNTDDFAFGTA